MNNIESLKEVIAEIAKQVQSSTDELNSALTNVGMHKVDLSDAITSIEEQVVSAESKFTIAFVGSFNAGKSTIINTLLDLKKEKRLTSSYDPETAHCVRIIKKGNKDCEAEIDYGEVYPVEKLTWAEAKKYTNHADLEKASQLTRERAKYINEIRYYVDSPLLELCNILDLPGTGSGSENGEEDENITTKKIPESDCCFLVLSTKDEPDPNTLSNLDKIKYKLLPIINVWQSEKEGLHGSFSPEDILNILQDSYSVYLMNAEDPIIYYAKEIDNAQQDGTEIKPEWGKDAFFEKVQQILNNIQSGDRAERIRTYLVNSLTKCKSTIEDVRADRKYIELKSEASKDSSEISKQFQRLERCKSIVSGDLNDASKKTADEIIGIISDASQSFIQTKMTGFNLSNMLKMFTKKQRDEISCELTEDFKKHYLKFDTDWLNKCVNLFCRDVIIILKSKYIDFSTTLNNDNNIIIDSDFSVGDITGFIDNIAGQLQKDAQSKMISLIGTALSVSLLFAIPGFALLDEVASVFSVGKSFKELGSDSKLRSKINMVVAHAKVQIRQQRYTIVSQLYTQAENIADQFYTTVKKQLDMDRNSNKLAVEKLAMVSHAADSFESMIKQAEQEIKEAMGG